MEFASTVDEDTERQKSAFCLWSAGSSENESKNASLPASSGNSFYIPLGSKITVRSLSGKIVFELEVGRDPMLPAEVVRAHVYLLRVHMFIAKKMSLPARCAKITWSFKKLATELSCEGVIIWNAINAVDDGIIDETGSLGKLDQCFICASECVDVDETTGARHKNCVRCFPSLLCDKCKIHLPKQAFDGFSHQTLGCYRSNSPEGFEWPVCFSCLQGSDLLFLRYIDLSPEQRFRLSVLNSDFSSRLSDI